MKQHIMSQGEAFTAAQNMREIEKCLGHSIPTGCLDATEYSDRLLSGGEAFVIAQNIREVERQRRFAPKPTRDSNSRGDNLLTVLCLGYLLCGIIAMFIDWLVSFF